MIERWVLLQWETLLSHTHKKGEKPGPSLVLRSPPFFVLQFVMKVWKLLVDHLPDLLPRQHLDV